MLNYQRVNSMILPAIYLKGKAPACMSSIVFLYVGLTPDPAECVLKHTRRFPKMWVPKNHPNHWTIFVLS